MWGVVASPATPNAQRVATWLRERRLATGKSQVQLAAEIGVGQRSIERWEAGQSVEHIATVLRLLSALGYELEAGEPPRAVSAELAELRRTVAESASELRALVAQLPGGPEALAEAQGRGQASE